MSHNHTTVAYHVSDGQSEQMFMFEHRSIHLVFFTPNDKNFTWFPHCTCKSPLSTLNLTLRTHTITTPTLHNLTILQLFNWKNCHCLS